VVPVVSSALAVPVAPVVVTSFAVVACASVAALVPDVPAPVNPLFVARSPPPPPQATSIAAPLHPHPNFVMRRTFPEAPRPRAVVVRSPMCCRRSRPANRGFHDPHAPEDIRDRTVLQYMSLRT